jgi:4-hydroxy-2-oxoglutarate aldolase
MLSGIDLDSDLLSALAQHPNIVGTKLSCANVGKLARLTSSFTKEQFAVFPGSAAITLPSLLCGSAGLIGALPNLFPAVHVKLYKLWEQGQIDDAMQIQQKLAHADWETQKMGVGGIKAIVSQQWGYGEPRVRGPLPSGDVGNMLQEGGVLDNLVRLEKGITTTT